MLYNQFMPSALMIPLAFLCGSLPFSVWLGKIFLKRDVRQYGDGNPGAANVFRAGNHWVGLLVLILDITKAAVPVGLAYVNFGIRGMEMALIAIAPILGHAFSPFLRFKGGKAIATVLGVWIGLTIWKASLPGVIGVIVGIGIFSSPGWAVMLGLSSILTVLLLWLPDPIFLAVLAGQILILGWTHRKELRHLPKLRPWLVRILHPQKD